MDAHRTPDNRPRRNTRQRQVILDALRVMHTHPTAVELHEVARRRLPKLSLATVYRNLKSLVADGTVRRLDFDGAQTRFDADTVPHHHVHCVRCGRVDDVHGPQIHLPEAILRNANGYHVIGHRLGFSGICPGCRDVSVPEDDERGSRPVASE